MPREKLTQERLKELLYYDPKIGVFIWRISRTGNKGKGSDAGCKDKDGYIVISVDGNVYFAHRLAYLFVYGYFPENDIDHEDRIKHHNWIDNLREVSRQCNLRNTGNPRHNKSGVKGVCFIKKSMKWIAFLSFNNLHKYLGCYKLFDNAVCARLAAEQCLGWEGCDSNSPAYKYVKANIIK